MKKYKLEFYPVIGSDPFTYLCETFDEVDAARNAIASYDIFLDDNGYRSIDANVAIVYIYNFEFGEWEEIEE